MRYRSTFSFAAVAITTTCLNSGCAEAHHVDIMTVLANGNCQTTEIGVRAIDYKTLATFRGTHLIGMTESDESTQVPVHLIAIVPAEFPTAGYSIALQDPPKLSVDQLTLEIKTERPPADTMLAQMITHPCLVVGIADPVVHRVRVVGANAAVLGEVDLTAEK